MYFTLILYIQLISYLPYSKPKLRHNNHFAKIYFLSTKKKFQQLLKLFHHNEL